MCGPVAFQAWRGPSLTVTPLFRVLAPAPCIGTGEVKGVGFSGFSVAEGGATAPGISRGWGPESAGPGQEGTFVQELQAVSCLFVGRPRCRAAIGSSRPEPAPDRPAPPLGAWERPPWHGGRRCLLCSLNRMVHAAARVLGSATGSRASVLDLHHRALAPHSPGLWPAPRSPDLKVGYRKS